MPEGLKDLIVNGVSVVAVIYGVIEALKQAGLLRSSIAPLVAIGIGVVCSVANSLFPQATSIVLLGAGLGIMASIGYAGLKKAADNASEAQKKVNEGTGVDA